MSNTLVETVTLTGGPLGGNTTETSNWPQNFVLQFRENNYERRGDVAVYIGDSPVGAPLPPVP